MWISCKVDYEEHRLGAPLNEMGLDQRQSRPQTALDTKQWEGLADDIQGGHLL